MHNYFQMLLLKGSLFSLFLIFGLHCSFKDVNIYLCELSYGRKSHKLCFRIGTKMVWCNDFMRSNLRVRKKRDKHWVVHKRRQRGRGQKLVKIVDRYYLKNCQYGGGICQKSGKIANVVYGWSLTHNYFQMLLPKGKPTQDAGALKCNFL